MVPATCDQCRLVFDRARRPKTTRFCTRACWRIWFAGKNRGFAPPANQPHGTVWVELGGGAFTLIDAADAVLATQHVWRAHRKPGKPTYAVTEVDGRTVLLHKLLLPGDHFVDHRNRDGLDNRRVNLRVASRAENGANRKKHANNTSGFRGVSRSKSSWVATLGLLGRQVCVGRYATAEEAARAYDAAAVVVHGAFAARNFPDEPLQELTAREAARIMPESALRTKPRRAYAR